MEKDVKLVVCSSDDGNISYSLHDYKLKYFVVTLDPFDTPSILNFCKGDVYLLGYLFNGKFFEQFFYLGKGSLE